MKLIRYILICVAISQFSSVFAQEILYSHSEDEVVANDKNAESAAPLEKQSKFSYSLNTGTSFSNSNFGNAFNVFIEPELRYRLSPKLSISTGFLLMNTSVSGLYSDMYNSGNNFSSAFISASVNYDATDRLRIRGEILYGMNKSPYSFGNKSNDYQLRFSAEYKITKSISVGVQVTKQNTYFSPFSSLGYNNGFNNNFMRY